MNEFPTIRNVALNGYFKRIMNTPDINDESFGRIGKNSSIEQKLDVARTYEQNRRGSESDDLGLQREQQQDYLRVSDAPADKILLRNGDEKCQVGNGKKQRKLILHFDIRNTILVADSVTNVNVDQALNTFLTGVTWGKHEGNEWMWLSDCPALGPPCLGAITYYKYLEEKLITTKSPDDRGRLRQATGDFTQQDLGRKFRDYFDKHMALLKWNFETADERLTMVGPDNGRYHYLLPSFIRLIYNLQAEGRDFAIILRTYGMDANNVLACLQHIVKGNHPQFPQDLPIRVSNSAGHIRRMDGGRIEVVPCENDTTENEDLSENAKIYNDERQIYEMLKDCSGITGFVDDFNYWHQNDYNHRSGKPFWIDLGDEEVQHIFFDDNIRVFADDSIVDVKLLRKGRQDFESISLEEMADLENACLVQADLLEIISNLEYFSEKVAACENSFAEMLKKFSLKQLPS